MACSLSITSVLGIPTVPGGTTTSTVRVTGTLAECEPIIFSPTNAFDVVLELDCGSGPVSATTLSSAGNWSVDIPATCACGKPIQVKASCATNPNCTDTFNGLLQCQEANCPTGTLAVSVDGCDANGKRLVTLTATVSAAPPGAQGQWDYGDAQPVGMFPVVVGQYIDTHPYTTPGPPNPARFVILQPPGCPPFIAGIPNLASCPINCPGIVTATATAGACNPDGTRTVHFDATLSGGPPQTYHWDFGHGSPVTIDATIPGATPAVDHAYPAPGTGTVNFTATFTVTGASPACVDTVPVAVAVVGCGGECPQIGPMTTQLDDCPDANTRNVTLSATVTGGGATEYEWEFGDGSPNATLNAIVNSDPTVVHLYAAPGSGPYTATVTMKGPPSCPDQPASKTFNVPACTDDDGDGGSGWCGALLPIIGLLVAVATALTVFVLALQICPTLVNVPISNILWGIIAGLWIAVGLALIGWAILCGFGICDCPSKCDFLAIAWMASLTGALVAVYLSGCCGGGPWFLVILIFGLAFLAGFGAWLAFCNPSKCQVVDLLLIVFVSIVAVVFTYIQNVPVVSMCVVNNVALAVAGIGAILAALAAACHAPGP